MRITYAKFQNFIGFYLAMGLTELEIDFTENINRVILTVGTNGSGKTSLLDALTLFPDIYSSREGSNFIIDDTEGYKEIHLLDNDVKYISKIHYLDKKTRCQLLKEDAYGNIVEDLNPSGNVRSYEEALEIHLGLDKSLNKILYIGPGLKDVLDMTPTERKNYISIFLPYVDEYLVAYKQICKLYSKLKSDLNVISFELNKIGDKDKIEADKSFHETQIEKLTNTLDKLKDARSKIELSLSTYEIDGMNILDFYKDNLIKYNNLLSRLYTLNDEYMAIKYKFNIKDNTDVDALILNKYDELSRCKYDLENLQSVVNSLDSNISNLTTNKKSKEFSVSEYKEKDDSRKYLIEREALEANLLNITSLCRQMEKENDILKDDSYLYIKDDCSRYLMFIDQLVERINNFKDRYTEYNIIDKFITETLNVAEIECEFDSLTNTLLHIAKEKLTIHDKLTYYNHQKNLKDLLMKRPSNCDNADCVFIDEANKFFSIENKLEDYRLKIQELTEKERDATQAKEDTETLLFLIKEFYSSLLDINNYIYNNAELISRFPTRTIITGDCLKTLLSNYGLLLPMARVFSEYSHLKQRKIELTDKINQLNELISKSSTYQNMIDDLELEIVELNRELENLMDKRTSLRESSVPLSLRIENLSNDHRLLTNMQQHKSKIVEMLRSAHKGNLMLKNTQKKHKHASILKAYLDKVNILIINGVTELNEHQKNYENIQFRLMKYDEFTTMKTNLEAKYKKVEVLRDTWSPTKGIPLVFIKTFMDKLKSYANEYLYKMWGDTLSIKEFIINEKDFFIVINRLDGDFATKDASLCSEGEKAVIRTVISLALLKSAPKSDRVYNIPKLDEIDSSLDYQRRAKFVDVFNELLDEIDCEQSFMITHNDEFNKNVDLILLKGSENAKSRDMTNSNVIFRY